MHDPRVLNFRAYQVPGTGHDLGRNPFLHDRHIWIKYSVGTPSTHDTSRSVSEVKSMPDTGSYNTGIFAFAPHALMIGRPTGRDRTIIRLSLSKNTFFSIRLCTVCSRQTKDTVYENMRAEMYIRCVQVVGGRGKATCPEK